MSTDTPRTRGRPKRDAAADWASLPGAGPGFGIRLKAWREAQSPQCTARQLGAALCTPGRHIRRLEAGDSELSDGMIARLDALRLGGPPAVPEAMARHLILRVSGAA